MWRFNDSQSFPNYDSSKWCLSSVTYWANTLWQHSQNMIINHDDYGVWSTIMMIMTTMIVEWYWVCTGLTKLLAELDSLLTPMWKNFAVRQEYTHTSTVKPCYKEVWFNKTLDYNKVGALWCSGSCSRLVIRGPWVRIPLGAYALRQGILSTIVSLDPGVVNGYPARIYSSKCTVRH